MNGSTVSWTDAAGFIAPLVISPIGILSGILSICALHRKFKTERSTFFVSMMLIAIFDLIFNILFMIFSLMTDETSWLYIFSGAFVFTISLASDLCALALTIDRYVALRWPHKKVSATRKTSIKVGLIVVITVISSLRTAYGIRLTVTHYFPPWVLLKWDNIEIYFYTFSDMILPFLLMPVMLTFSVLIIFATQKRRRGKVRNFGTAATQNTRQLEREKREKMKSIMYLTLMLDAFFLVNQIGYCTLTVSKLYTRYCESCSQSLSAYKVAVWLSDFVECLSRSLNFYFYICFSSLIRNEFYAFLGAMKRKIFG